MKDTGRMLWLAAGLFLGLVAAALYLGQAKPLQAANDRYEDYIMCTGTVTSTLPSRTRASSPMDGVWLLDYRSGKLLGTVIERNEGRVLGWAEVDLVAEFAIPPRQNVHFMMTTGNVSFSKAALYVAETTTGKFGVYTMAPRPDGLAGIAIRRHDLVNFRQNN
jgi:hypothetical protein